MPEKKLYSLKGFPSQPFTLPQQRVGEYLTPGFLNAKQHEAVSADFCAVNTPTMADIKRLGKSAK